MLCASEACSHLATTFQGVVEYARGSHLWQKAAVAGSDDGLAFHGSSGAAYQVPLQKAADAAGVAEGDVDIVRLNVPAGVCV